MSEFEFDYPLALLLLPLAPLLGWWLVRRRRPALRYSDVSLLVAVPSAAARWAKWGGATLRALAVALTVLAVANPRVPDLKTRLPAEGIAITLAVDVSGSMNTADFDPTASPPVSRLDAARQTFALFVKGGQTTEGNFEGRANDQISLVTFAAVPETVCPLTHNHSVLLTVIAALEPKSGLDAGTNVGDALGLGLAGFDALTRTGDTRPKVLVLLSDGEHNKEGSEVLRPLQAAQLAQRLNIPIYTIDCGGDAAAGNADERKQRADGRAVLEDVAAVSGGRAFVANNPDELRAAFAEIDQLAARPAVTYRYRKHWSFAPWCGLAAVLCVFALGVLERTLWRRLP
jgi:Ca-activated chloride channel family protein